MHWATVCAKTTKVFDCRFCLPEEKEFEKLSSPKGRYERAEIMQ